MNIRFDVNPKRILWALLAVIAALTAADIAIHILRFGFGRDHILGLIPFLDFGEEKNLPSWFSSIQLALAALLVTSIAVRKFEARDGQRFMWALLAIGFWYLSLDETASLHEYWAPNSGKFDITRGLFTYRWVMVGLPVIAAVGLLFSRFVFSLPKRTRNAVIGTGMLYVWSAVGVEMLQALYHSTYRVQGFVFQMITVVEETGEMVAIALFIVAMMRYIQDESTRAAMRDGATVDGNEYPIVAA